MFSNIKLKYDEFGCLRDLLICIEGVDSLSPEQFDNLVTTLQNHGLRYPPCRPGQTCYYLEQIPLDDDSNETTWTVAESEIKQITYNDFGDWVLLANFDFPSIAQFGVDIFTNYAEAQRECFRRNSINNPEV